MQTHEPLTTTRLYELCELAKTSGPMVEISREELWALVDAAKERNEIFRDAERWRWIRPKLVLKTESGVWWLEELGYQFCGGNCPIPTSIEVAVDGLIQDETGNARPGGKNGS